MSDTLTGWFAGRLPEEWGTPEITVDREEITVVLTVEAPEGSEEGRLSRWREETREERIAIAREAEGKFGRKVAWGANAGSTHALFTHLAVPVMTRLRQPQRLVLDTLVDSGVARSRAEALAWCVKLVGQHEEQWLAELRTAMESVEKVRSKGPAAAQ
jgi:hypothetical protein